MWPPGGRSPKTMLHRFFRAKRLLPGCFLLSHILFILQFPGIKALDESPSDAILCKDFPLRTCPGRPESLPLPVIFPAECLWTCSDPSVRVQIRTGQPKYMTITVLCAGCRGLSLYPKNWTRGMAAADITIVDFVRSICGEDFFKR